MRDDAWKRCFIRMMKMKNIIVLCTVFLGLSLTACVSTEQADAKLQRGCQAGLVNLIEPREIIETKSVNFSNELQSDGMYRRVTFDILEQDGWAEMDKTYSCLFIEQWGPFKSSYDAVLVQVNLGEDGIVGNDGGKLIGELEDFMKLTEVVDAAMGN